MLFISIFHPLLSLSLDKDAISLFLLLYLFLFSLFGCRLLPSRKFVNNNLTWTLWSIGMWALLSCNVFAVTLFDISLFLEWTLRYGRLKIRYCSRCCFLVCLFLFFFCFSFFDWRPSLRCTWTLLNLLFLWTEWLKVILSLLMRLLNSRK